MIPFHKCFLTGTEADFINDAIKRKQFSGRGFYTNSCESWLQEYTEGNRVLLTSSCTHALEMCALLCGIQPGDEVIMASFNFVSAPNAFVLRGANIVYIDINPETLNISHEQIEAAISERTKAVLVMHYGSVACEMDSIMALSKRFGFWVIEDAAHCIGARYKGRHLGTIGHLGTVSFHATKNIHCGEGGAILINDNRFLEQAEIIREKGTDRAAFERKEVDRYIWRSLGSSYLMNEITAAFLWAQLGAIEDVMHKRRRIWDRYRSQLNSEDVNVDLCRSSDEKLHNGHIFHLRLPDEERREGLIKVLAIKGIDVRFHYQPLHVSPFGRKTGRFIGSDQHTIRVCHSLVRLPIFPDLTLEEVDFIAQAIIQFCLED